MTDANDLAFFPGIAEKLGYYVYLLVDPRDDEVFYVGKGLGERAWHHSRGTGSGTDKLDRIRAIQSAGMQVRVEVLRHGMTEPVAFAVEAAAIDLLRLGGNPLTNAVAGHDTGESGWASLDDLRARYGAEPVVIDPADRVLMIRINRAYKRGMSDEQLYTATRQWWRMAPHRHNPTVALAVYNGVVRRAYRIDSWTQRDSDQRWQFTGQRTDELAERYEWRDVSAFVAAGAQNPISYVNCAKPATGSAGAEIEIDEPEQPSADGAADIVDRAVLIRIGRSFKPNMSEHDLYTATREWWRMDPTRHEPELALAVYQGRVQRVYRIDSWEQRDTDGRWRFTGFAADDAGARYEGMDVSGYYTPGAQNPITYVNC